MQSGAARFHARSRRVRLDRPVRRSRTTRTCASTQRAENFPVALRVLPARPAHPPRRGLRRRARDRRPRRRGARRPDRAADRRSAPTWRPIWDGGAPAGAGAAPAGAAPCAACGLTAAAVRRPDRGEPARPDALSTTRPTPTCVAYCELSANPVGRIVLEVFGASTPRAGRAVRPDLHRAADHRALPGRRRGPPGRPHLPAAGRPRPVRRRPGPTSTRARRRPRCARLIAFEVDRAAALLDVGPAAARPAARLGPAGGRPATWPVGGPRSIALRRADWDVLPACPHGPTCRRGSRSSSPCSWLAGGWRS